MKTMSLVEVVGKQYKRVSVLLTPTMVAAIQALVDKRAEGGVKTCNPHVFAQGHCNFKRGSKCIRRTVQACTLQFPERITSTKLRKYLATVSQVFNLSQPELEELARHMGHELSVHRRFYRLQDDVIELAKVSRLLMSIEEGNAGQFAGCSLDDINIGDFEEGEDDIEEDEGDDDDGAEQDFDIQSEIEAEEDEEDLPTEAPHTKKRNVKADGAAAEEEDEEDLPTEAPPTKKRKVQVPQKDKKCWSIVEKEILQLLVQAAVRNGKPPCKAEVAKLQTNRDSSLYSLPWLKIKHQVWAMAQSEIKKKENIIADIFP